MVNSSAPSSMRSRRRMHLVLVMVERGVGGVWALLEFR